MAPRPTFLARASFVLGLALVSRDALAYSWREIGPPARSDHAAVYDPTGDRLIVFGGLEGATPHGDVWALSLSGTPSWSKLPIFSVARPSKRSGHTAVYDPVRKRVMVFGGGDGTLQNDVWAFTPSSQTWSQLAPTGAPPSPRRFHTAIYDPVGDRMLVFGGNDGARKDDAWALTLSGTPAWTLLAPSGTPPSAREGASALYDPTRQRMLVFGGLAGSGVQNDTWSLDLAGPPAWAQVATSGPAPAIRAFHAAVYDPVRDRMVVLGGGTSFAFNDAAALTLSGSPTWQSLFPFFETSHAPAIYDPARDRILVHGGSDNGSCFNVTFALALSPSVAYSVLRPSGPNPFPIRGASGVYDYPRFRFIVFGGLFWSGFEPQYNPSALAMDVTTGVWTDLGGMGRPREGHSACIVTSGTQRMMTFGGACMHLCPSYPYNDVWELALDGSGPWKEVLPGGPLPPARSRHTAIYDPIRNSLIVFGGVGSELTFPTVRYNDVWELNLDPNPPVWSQWAPVGAPPSARCGHSVAYDHPNRRMVVFGGRDSNGLLDDVWALSLTGTPTWTQLAPQGAAPTPREDQASGYWQGTVMTPAQMLVYGGSTQTDVWVLSLGLSPAWSQQAVVGPDLAPDGHARLAAAGSGPGALFVYGGRSMGAWELDIPYGLAVEPPVPSGLRLHLANPARGPLVVGFELPERAPARLELFDLAGREVDAKDVGSPGAGVQRVALGGARLRSGMYVVRVVQGARSSTAKVLVTR